MVLPALLLAAALGGLFAAAAVLLWGPLRLAWAGFSCTTPERPLLIAGAAFLFLALLLRKRGNLPVPARPWLWGLLALGLLWTGLYGGLGVYFHRTWRSSSLDLALHSQILWNLLRGRFMESSFFEHSFAANHFWPGLYLFAPVYGLLGSEGMIVLQAAWVAAGAFAAYFLGDLVAGGRRWGLAAAAAYLLHPTLAVGVLFDYHFELFAVAPALFGIYFLERKTWLPAAGCLALAVSLYEVTALPFLGLGLVYLFRPGYRKAGLVLAAACGAYLAVLVEWAMPAFRSPGYFPHRYRFRKLGSTPWAMAANFLSAPAAYLRGNATPGRLDNLLYLFRSFAFLPVLGAEWLLPVVPVLIGLYLSSYELQFDIRVGYLAVTLPFFLLAALRGARRLFALPGRAGRWWREYGPFAFLAVALASSLQFQIHRQFRTGFFSPPPYLGVLEEAARHIPPGVSLTADNHLGPRFLERDVLLVTPQFHFRGEPVDCVFTDFNNWARKGRVFYRRLRKYVQEGTYAPVFFSGGVLVLRRDRRDPAATRAVLDYMDSRPDLKSAWESPAPRRRRGWWRRSLSPFRSLVLNYKSSGSKPRVPANGN